MACAQKLWLFAVLLLVPLLMAHHPGYPAPIALDTVDDADQGDGWVMTATPGLIRGSDSPALICKEAFGATGNLYAAVLGDTHFAVAANEGLAITFDGCYVDAFHPINGRQVDVASQGSDLIAVAASDIGQDRIYYSLDGGLTLADPVDVDAGLRLTGVGFSDSDHLVATAFDDDADPRGQARLVVVTNLDTTPTVETHSYASGLRYPYLFAADHGQVAVALRDNISPMAAWGPPDDPGRYIDDLNTWPLHAQIDADGSLRIGPITEDWTGLWHSDDQHELQAMPDLDGHDTRCIVANGDDFWLCSSGAVEAYELWRLTTGDDPPSLNPIYRLAYLDGPRDDCPPDSEVAQICPDHWTLTEATIPAWEPDEEQPDEPEDPEEPGEPEEPNPPPPGSTPVDPPQDPPEESSPADQEASGGCAQTDTDRTDMTTLLALLLLLLLRHAAELVGRPRKNPDDKPEERWSY